MNGLEQINEHSADAVVQSYRNIAKAEKEPVQPAVTMGEAVSSMTKSLVSLATDMYNTNHVRAYNQLGELIDTALIKAYEDQPTTAEGLKEYFTKLEEGKNAIIENYHLYSSDGEAPAELNQLYNQSLIRIKSIFKANSKSTLRNSVGLSMDPALNKNTIEEMDIKLQDPTFVSAVVSSVGEEGFEKAKIKFYTTRLQQTMGSHLMSIDQKNAFVDNFKSIPLTDDYKKSLKDKALSNAVKNMPLDITTLGLNNPEVLRALEQDGITDKDGKFTPIVKDNRLQITMPQFKELIETRKKEDREKGKTGGNTYLMEKYYQEIEKNITKDPKGTALSLGNYKIEESSDLVKNPTNTVKNMVETIKMFGAQGVSIFTQTEMAQFSDLGLYEKQKVMQGITSDIVNNPQSSVLSNFTDGIARKFITPDDKSLFHVNMLQASGGLLYKDWNNNDTMQLVLDLSPNANQGKNVLQNKTREVSSYVRSKNYEKAFSGGFWGKEITKDKYAFGKALGSIHNPSDTNTVVIGMALKHAGLDHLEKVDDGIVETLLKDKHITIIGNAIVNGDATVIRDNIFRQLNQYDEKIDRQNVYDHGDLYRASNGEFRYVDNKTGKIIVFNKTGQQIGG